MSKSTRRVDAIRCDAGVLPRCSDDPGIALLRAVSKRGIRARLRFLQYRLGGIIPALRCRVREWFLQRRAKRITKDWLLRHIPPHILAIPPDRLSYTQLNALRLIIEKEWRDFDAMTPASETEIEEWLATRCIDPAIRARVERTRAMLGKEDTV